MILAHKIRLIPTKKQRKYFQDSAGVARYAYNWALERWKADQKLWKEYTNAPFIEGQEQGIGNPPEKPTAITVKKAWTQHKKSLSWANEVCCYGAFDAIYKGLGGAYNNYFKGLAKYPTFHKKGRKDSFSIRGANGKDVRLDGKKLFISKLCDTKKPETWIKLTERLRINGKIGDSVISRKGKHWYVSIMVDATESPRKPVAKSQGTVGVDLGLIDLATLSNGEVFKGPKALKYNLKKLRRLSKAHSRKMRGSKNKFKSQMKLAALHEKIANIRQDSLHKLTSYLTEHWDTVVIEDLNVKGMMSCSRLARSIADMGFYMFKNMLTYKAIERNVKVILANRWFPSSQICHHCGHRDGKKSLDIREWQCTSCNSVVARDYNAAKNLEKLGTCGSLEAEGHSVLAWGEPSCNDARKVVVKSTKGTKKSKAEAKSIS